MFSVIEGAKLQIPSKCWSFTEQFGTSASQNHALARV